jgi:hypothetical protein
MFANARTWITLRSAQRFAVVWRHITFLCSRLFLLSMIQTIQDFAKCNKHNISYLLITLRNMKLCTSTDYKYSRTPLKRHRFMRDLTYTVRYSAVQINVSPFKHKITLLGYNKARLKQHKLVSHFHDVITEIQCILHMKVRMKYYIWFSKYKLFVQDENIALCD